MIADLTQPKLVKTVENRAAVYGFCLACKEYTLERVCDGVIKCYSCQAEMSLTINPFQRWEVTTWQSYYENDKEDPQPSL